MATYGYDEYGQAVYGPSAPTGPYPGSQATLPTVNTNFILPSFTATPQDYTTLYVEWTPMAPATASTVTEFRLLASKWGFPVDQNDGTILLDVTGSPAAPGTQFVDVTAVPGQVQYYAVYVLSGTSWLRAGFTACLLPYYHGYDVRLISDLPVYFQNQVSSSTAVDQALAAPNVPSSGGSVTNPYDFGVNVSLSEAANVSINGLPFGTQTFFVLPPLGTVVMSYSGAMTWQWIAPAGNAENTTLEDFLSVVGMGLDLVKTQYDLVFNSLNDPMSMSLGDLASLCAEIGLPYNAEIPAYTMRKAALFWTRVMQERGTIGGIAEHITLLTGYGADVQTSRNILLDDDQSEPLDTIYPQWSASTPYVVGNIVQYPSAAQWSVASVYAVGNVVMYNDLFYTCTVATTANPPTNTSFWSQNVAGPYLYYCLTPVTSSPGVAPSGSTSANGTWSCVYGGNANGSEFTNSISIPGLSGTAGTWEFLEPAGTQLGAAFGVGFPTPQAWVQGAGSPTTGPNGYGHTFRAVNTSGTTQANTWLRSVCRQASDISGSKIVPDPQLIVEHAVPVPQVTPWNSTTTYFTNTIVTYNNLNYTALRQSTGALPPSPGAVLDVNNDFEATSLGTTWVIGTPPANITGSVSASTTQHYHGTQSLQFLFSSTSTGFATGAGLGAFSAPVAVQPGSTVLVSGLVYAVGSGQQCRLGFHFFDVWGNDVGSAFGGSGTITPTAATWTSLNAGPTTVPAGAVSMKAEIEPIAPTTGSSFSYTYYFDLVNLYILSTPEWAPLGQDQRLPITLSGYAISDLAFAPTVSTTVTPFVEWYDNWGNLITRVFARSASTSGGYPSNYQFDSFSTAAGTPLAGRVPAIPGAVWSVPVGGWTISSSGNVYAGTLDADSLGIVPSPAAGLTAVTVTNPAQAGDDCGPVFWYENTSNFWMAGLLQLYYVESGTTNTVSYTGTVPATGDRIIVQYNNTTSVTTLPNTTTVTGPSVVVYKNTVSTANQLLVVGSGGTATQTAMSSLTTPYLPTTGATASNAGIGSIAT